MSTWTAAGVDWDSGSWLAVGVTAERQFEAAHFDQFKALWSKIGAAIDRIVVDVPIGLCGPSESSARTAPPATELSRACDDLCRTLIEDRRSSVFNPPCRPVVEDALDDEFRLKADIYQEMNEKNRAYTGKGLMQQALYITPGIAEVESVLSDCETAKSRIYEGHPELCFRALGTEPLHHIKRTAPGLIERLDRLTGTEEFSPSTWRDLARSLGASGYTTGIDDLIDAIGLALTACADEDSFQSLPAAPPTDATGLPMQMVYRRSAPFDVE